MSGLILSLVFAFLAASIAWQCGKRAWTYLKIARDFLQGTSAEETVLKSGRTFLIAGIAWGLGTLVSFILTGILLMMGVFSLMI